MRLTHTDGTPVQIGDTVTSFRGEKARVVGITEPHEASSTGRVTVRFVEGALSEYTQSYFPSVFNLKWEGRMDR